jgi:pilus assembly protein CpaE
VLLDLDLMFGDVAISLQLMPSSSVRDVVAMTGHIDIQGIRSVVTRHEASGLDVIAAPADPADADRVPASIVTELLRVARGAYDYVLVDTPPSFTEQVLAAIDASDLTVLIATLDIPAVKNLRIAINTLDTLGTPPEGRIVVLNRADAKVGLKAGDVEAALKHHISASVPNSISVPSSVNRGVAIVLDDPRGAVSTAIREFADTEIRERFGQPVPRASRRGLGLGRVKR